MHQRRIDAWSNVTWKPSAAESMKETDKSRYIEEAESRYHEIAANLTGIKDKVDQATVDDVRTISEPIKKLLHQAETQLATVQEILAQLKPADEASWQSDKRTLETAWEDLSRSIMSLVTRIH